MPINVAEGTKKGVAKLSRKYTVKTALTDYFQGTIGESKLREALRKGEIPHARIGTRYIMREEALDEWMACQEEASTERRMGATKRAAMKAARIS